MTTHNNKHTPHILPLSLYLTIGGVLLVLTAVTVMVSFYQFGPFNLLIAMFIAAVKASLVAMYFMHLKYDSKIYLVIFVMAILFLATFITFTMFDTLQRDQMYPMKSGQIRKDAIIYEIPNVADSSATTFDSSANPVDTAVTGNDGH